MALTEKQQEKVQVCEKNWKRRIVGVKKVDQRRMDELRVEVRVRESLKNTLVRSRLKWAGHVKRMGGEKLAMKADARKVEGKRLRVQWEDCVKRDLESVGGEWRTIANDRSSERKVRRGKERQSKYDTNHGQPQQEDNNKRTTTRGQQQEANNKRTTTRGQQQEDNNKRTTTRGQQQEDNNKRTTTRGQQQEDNKRTTTRGQQQEDNNKRTTTR